MKLRKTSAGDDRPALPVAGNSGIDADSAAGPLAALGRFNFALPENRFLPAILVFLITALFFLPSLAHDFVAWDDDITFYKNPHIQGLDAERIHWMFTDVNYTMRYKPLSWLLYAFIFSVNGMNPLGFHLAGLLFHSVNAVLVYAVLRRFLETGQQVQGFARRERLILAAMLGAIFWAVHPLRVEAVDRATDLVYCQSLCFVLISLWCHLRAVALRTQGGAWKRWHAAALAAFAVAMLSYPFFVCFAGVLLILDFYPLRRFPVGSGWWRNPATLRLLVEKAPFLLVGGIAFITFLGPIHPDAGAVGGMAVHRLGWLARMMQSIYVWMYYLWKPGIPLQLSPVYATLVNFNPLEFRFVASAIAFAGLTLLLIWKRREWPLALALWVCHLVLQLPALGLTENPHFTCDRYDYGAGIFWPALLAAGFATLNWKPSAIRRLALSGVVVALGLGVLSLRQARVWENSETLFRHMLAELRDNPYRADIAARFGYYYMGQNKAREAVEQFQDSLRVNPDSAFARNMLGFIFLQQGENAAAAGQLEAALRLEPRNTATRNNLATALAALGRAEEAIRQYQAVLEIDGNNADATLGLAAQYVSQHRFEDAIPLLQKYLTIQPESKEAKFFLKAALEKRGNH